MRLTQTTTANEEVLPYNVIKILGCMDSVVGFEIKTLEPTITKRRYCNKVLVHECVPVPELEPLALDRVEFLATNDPCYRFFNLFKSSDTIGTVEPTITLQYNEDEEPLVIGILVNFTKEETCCLPLRMSYRINGYDPDGMRVNLGQGNLNVSPSGCATDCDDCEPVTWVDVDW